MRTHHTAGTAAVAALLAPSGRADAGADHAGMSDEGKPTPAHTVVKDTDHEAELPAPDASEETATVLLHRWVGAPFADAGPSPSASFGPRAPAPPCAAARTTQTRKRPT
ncbi:hypothetical protein ACIOG8_18050 [Streptomyces erythrochromogenes]|uniref:hypothetical protein n=1 Tax=Streptomyces erythrochromogenes TaxID=285574 RepID=UPI0037FCB4AF